MPLHRKVGFLASSLLASSLAVSAFGQAAPPDAPPAPGNGGRRNFDPAQFRQRMMDRLKTDLGASDDEMKALQPKIEKVLQLQRDAGGRFGGRRGGQGGQGGQPGGTPPSTANESPVQQKATDLQTTLENKDAKPEDIKAKLDALRAAKTQARQELTSAQQELKGLLTQRQEAVLVERGLLE